MCRELFAYYHTVQYMKTVLCVTVLDYTCVFDLAVQLCARLPNFSLVA